jgi:RND family efflux transporter MFP subunit
MNNHTTRSQFQPPFRPEAENSGDFTPFCLPTTELLPELPARLKSDRQFATLGPKAAYAQPVSSRRLVIRPRFAFPGKLVRKKRILLGLFLLLASVFFIWFFVSARTADVTLYQVSAQDATPYISGGGVIFPRQQLSLSYPLPEKALAVFVKVGDEVTPNQPLLKLDPTQLNAQAKQLSDDVAAAHAYLASVSASGNASAIAVAQQQYSLAKSKYNAFVAGSAPLLLHNGNLISPMRGVVTTVNISPGEVFAANMPLLIIMDESTVIVHVKVPLANLSQVHTGMQAIATPSALPDLNFKGTISAIVPQADPQTDTFEVWVSIENSSKALLPGMSVFVRIQAAGRAMVVPRPGILSPDKDAVAFVVRDQHAYVQHVHVAGEVRDELLVDAGLARGDTIVLVGQCQLRDGQAIRVQSVET